ncbi:MAG: SRPBCC family protein [Chloroflexi bacterium]|nr:SRPBCC family protein [Chloroflexota bacterium]
MPKFQKTIQVNAPAAKTWELIGNLVAMGGLAGATEVRMEGMTRICRFPNGIVQHEEISDYSEDRRSYNYAIEGSPLPVKNNRGRFTVKAAGLHSSIVWEAEFETLDPSQEGPVSDMWEGAMDQVLASLKQRIETEG